MRGAAKNLGYGQTIDYSNAIPRSGLTPNGVSKAVVWRIRFQASDTIRAQMKFVVRGRLF